MENPLLSSSSFTIHFDGDGAPREDRQARLIGAGRGKPVLGVPTVPMKLYSALYCVLLSFVQLARVEIHRTVGTMGHATGWTAGPGASRGR